jgi:hypothetical protein
MRQHALFLAFATHSICSHVCDCRPKSLAIGTFGYPSPFQQVSALPVIPHILIAGMPPDYHPSLIVVGAIAFPFLKGLALALLDSQ